MKKPISSTYHPQSPNFYSFRGSLQTTRANLPHWNKKNTACFVTFRLFDSLPREKILRIKELEDCDQAEIQDCLDQGFGSCLLGNSSAFQAMEDVLWHFAGEQYDLYCYVIMPNHVHVLFMPLGENSISDIVAGWKSVSSHQINALLGRQGPVWQKESFDTLVRSERHFQTIIRYIKSNDLNKYWCS